MSIYAVIRDTTATTDFPADLMRNQDVAVWDGIQAGVFRAETLRNANCGTVIGLVADDEQKARKQLAHLPFIANGNVVINLGELGPQQTTAEVDCADVQPIPPIEERLPQPMRFVA